MGCQNPLTWRLWESARRVGEQTPCRCGVARGAAHTTTPLGSHQPIRCYYVSAVGDNNRGNNERRDTYALLKPGARSADIRERRHIESTGGSLRSEAITHSFFIDNSFMNKRLMLMLSPGICIPFWSLDHLDLADDLNEEIWRDSPARNGSRVAPSFRCRTVWFAWRTLYPGTSCHLRSCLRDAEGGSEFFTRRRN